MRLAAKTIGSRALWTCLATTVAAGCAGGSAPDLDGLGDQVAQVGSELQISLQGTDPDGGHLSYGFHVADLDDVTDSAQVTVSPDGSGLFRWTPLASDVGVHPFDFTVSDGSHTTTVTINIDVRSAIGSQTAPIFRQPLGTGTTMDMTVENCTDVSIVIQDDDSAQVTIAQEEPVIDGAELQQTGGTTATWHWCPTKAQLAENRYTLVLSADDGDNPKVIKNYLIVLRDGNAGENCPGGSPTIDHSPADETTILDLTISATVNDDKGIKDAPLFYFSTKDPGPNPNLAEMTQLTMLEISGDATNGEWAADVPNPVASMSPGSTATLYYVIVADDDDDTMGNCDHITTSPVYTMTVTAGGSSTAEICGTCSADSQCGDGNECVFIGNTGDTFCLQSCDAGCPSGYTCSSNPILSVDGADARQCVPVNGTCTDPTASCADDMFEDNDSRTQASHNPELQPDFYDLVSCPSATGTNADDDWFKIVLPADSRVDFQLSGDGATDVDLHLYHSDGTVVTASTSSASDEEINTCLPKATYYVKVNAFGHARSEYLLEYDRKDESCQTTCVDDAKEDDDTFSQARNATSLPFSSTGNTICPNDDDWFHVVLFTGQTLSVDLTFTQTDETGDLDLHLYQGSLDLTPCDLDNPFDCSPDLGQSASAPEHMTYVVGAGCESGCDYDVVVRGWAGATNNYSIAIDAN